MAARESARGGARRQRPPLTLRLQNYWLSHVQNFVGGLGRLFKQPFSSLMTIAVIGIALALPAGLHVLVLNGKALSGNWESAVDLSVYLHRDVPMERVEKLGAELEAREDVAQIEVISPNAALDEFREHSGFGAALDALEDNPLPAAMVLRPATDRQQPGDIEALADALGQLEEVELVQLDTQWVRRFHAILDAVRQAVLVAAIVLAAGVIIIVGNTIRLDIQNRRDEIEVTKLVGGTDRFIRRPFLYSGLWYGLAGGIFAVLLVNLALLIMAGPVQRIAGLYGSQFELLSPPPDALLVMIAGGAGLGWLGSWIAATRHLRGIEPQ